MRGHSDFQLPTIGEFSSRGQAEIYISYRETQAAYAASARVIQWDPHTDPSIWDSGGASPHAHVLGCVGISYHACMSTHPCTQDLAFLYNPSYTSTCTHGGCIQNTRLGGHIWVHRKMHKFLGIRGHIYGDASRIPRVRRHVVVHPHRLK